MTHTDVRAVRAAARLSSVEWVWLGLVLGVVTRAYWWSYWWLVLAAVVIYSVWAGTSAVRLLRAALRDAERIDSQERN